MTYEELKQDMSVKFPIAYYWLEKIVDYVWKLIEQQKGESNGH